jgi:thioredoxin 1
MQERSKGAALSWSYPERDATMSIIQTTDSSFDVDVLKSDTPVVVDFWAEWCGPCKSIATYLEDLAKDRGETLRVAKVNIDENPLTPTKYGVRGIPTLMLFKNGEIAATKLGAVPKTKLYEWVDESL